MVKVHQTRSADKRQKPKKPSKDYPLFAHAAGVWAKKVRGRLHYFGPWSDPKAALEKWLREKDDLLAGRTPRSTPDSGVTIANLANRFLTSKLELVKTNELTQRSFQDYHATCARIVATFGKPRLVDDLAADDFEHLRAVFAKTLGPVSLCNEIGRVRVLFKYGYDAGLIDKPVRYGPGFKRPSRKTLRQARVAAGPRMFEADELRKIVDKAEQPLKAMILLAINCGFGQSDVARLPLSAVNLTTGWIDYPRPKTAIARRCPLWPETIEAVAQAIDTRPKPAEAEDGELMFLTKYGRRWVRTKESKKGKSINLDAVAGAFGKVLKLDINGRRNFYAIRHTFETIGGDSRDQVAVNGIMGHAPEGNDMASVYRERISDDRLKAVTDHVHGWLFGDEEETQDASETTAAAVKSSPKKK